MILLATRRESISYSPLAILSLSCLTFSARRSSHLRTSCWAILCGSQASLETLTLADPTVRPTSVLWLWPAWPAVLPFCINLKSSAAERPLWMTSIVLSQCLLYIRLIGKTASFFSPNPNLLLSLLYSDFKDFLSDN